MLKLLRVGFTLKIALIMLMTLALLAIMFKFVLIIGVVFVLLAAGYWAAAPMERTAYGFREDLTGRPYW